MQYNPGECIGNITWEFMGLLKSFIFSVLRLISRRKTLGWAGSSRCSPGGRRKTGGEKPLLGWQESLWDLALWQQGTRAFGLIAGSSKADRIAPHIDSGFDVAFSSARAEVKRVFYLIPPSHTPSAWRQDKVGQEQGTLSTEEQREKQKQSRETQRHMNSTM